MGWIHILIFLASVVSSHAQDIQCESQADLYFVIDGSDSLSDEDFAESKNFVVDVLNVFDVQSGAIHVGANVFGTDVTDRIQLHGPSKMMYALFERRIQTLSRFRSGTATYKALAEMREEFQLRGRDGVTKIGIVITDGKSTNSSATMLQSLQAKSDGINMIAIVITTTSTTTQASTIAADTTTSETTNPDDFDCKDCMIDDTHGFWKHPHNCEKYIEIIADTEGNRQNLIRKCKAGLFWDQYHSTCRRPEQVKCDHDPCLKSNLVSYNIEGMCSGYILCVKKRSTRACCPVAQRYVGGIGCVPDPTCSDDCHGDDNRLVHPEACDKTPHPTDNRYYIQDEGEGHAPKTLPCAPGTIFNNESCMCDLFDDRPLVGSLTDCSPAANFPFEGNFADTSGQNAYAGTEFVEIASGTAKFAGKGMINIYRFSMDDFGQKLVMKIKFKQSATAQGIQALVTNCVYSAEQGSSLSIKVDADASQVIFSTDTELKTSKIRVPFAKGIWNEATYIYDGNKLYGMVFNGTNPAVMKASSLNGDILMRKSGIVLGAGSQLDYFTGNIDDFQLYKCFPAFADYVRGQK
ncbi:collagen [Mactra antiquata]